MPCIRNALYTDTRLSYLVYMYTKTETYVFVYVYRHSSIWGRGVAVAPLADGSASALGGCPSALARSPMCPSRPDAPLRIPLPLHIPTCPPFYICRAFLHIPEDPCLYCSSLFTCPYGPLRGLTQLALVPRDAPRFLPT